MQAHCESTFDFALMLANYMPREGEVSILDAGASIGLSTMLLMQASWFGAQIFAVEGHPGSVRVRLRTRL